jgi:hypothetical protein
MASMVGLTGIPPDVGGDKNLRAFYPDTLPQLCGGER